MKSFRGEGTPELCLVHSSAQKILVFLTSMDGGENNYKDSERCSQGDRESCEAGQDLVLCWELVCPPERPVERMVGSALPEAAGRPGVGLFPNTVPNTAGTPYPQDLQPRLAPGTLCSPVCAF